MSAIDLIQLAKDSYTAMGVAKTPQKNDALRAIAKLLELRADEIIAANRIDIENGIAKEQARAVLPEGLTVSRLYMKGNLRSWIHYCQLRMDPATQLEHREVASACWDIICDQFPSVKELLRGDTIEAAA